MATFKRPYNSQKVTRADEDATPAQKKEVARTGRQPGEPVGDSVKVKKDSVEKSDNSSTAPSGVNKEVWAQAEHSAVNMGGFSGVDKKGREDLIRVQYDKMIATDKADKEWAGKNGVLGDVK